MGERRAEIVADEAITKVTTPETWGEAMAALLVEVKAGRPATASSPRLNESATCSPSISRDRQTDTNEIPGQAHRTMTDDRDAPLESHVGGQVSSARSSAAAGNMSRAPAARMPSSSSPSMRARSSSSSSIACRVGERCLELPAGLVGDEDEHATVEGTAVKELEEETGFTSERIERLGEFHSSPGMVAESFTLVRAHGVRGGRGRRQSRGGNRGPSSLPRAEIADFVAARRAEGMAIDVKLLLFADF